MKILITLGVAVVAAALGAIGVAYSGLYNVAASSPDGPITSWFFSTISRASIKRRVDDIETPDLSDEWLLQAGVNDFNSMCVGCHGGPGIEAEALGQGLNPPAPNLAQSSMRMTPAELFWVTKNGIKMTGMPAWGMTHDDDELWPVVALMTRLSELDADSYQALVASAEGMGRHADSNQSQSENGHDHGAHSHAKADPVKSVSEHDHSTHDHSETTPAEQEASEDDDHEH